MEEQMRKEQLLETMRRERAEWDALIARVGPARLLEPLAEREWSTQDVIAHIAWYEEQLAGNLERRGVGTEPLSDLDVHARNAEIHNQSRELDLTPDEALRRGHAAFRRLYLAVQGLSDEELASASHFEGMPIDWVPWKLVGSESYRHYHQHIPSIRAWLESNRASEALDIDSLSS